jgi:hypothetical protein
MSAPSATTNTNTSSSSSTSRRLKDDTAQQLDRKSSAAVGKRYASRLARVRLRTTLSVAYLACLSIHIKLAFEALRF